VSAADGSKILSRDVPLNVGATGKSRLCIADVNIPWSELGVTPAAGQELRILAIIQSGEGKEAIIHTNGEIPKQPVEQSVSRWPKYKLAEKP
jgi:hypothetical protein